MMKILEKGKTLSQVGAWVSGSILLATSILITIEVLLRKLFSISMGGADEISGYAMAVSCSWAFAFALFKKAHIRIDILYVKFPKNLRYLLDIASLTLFGVYMSLLSYYAFHVFLTSFSRNSTANTPLHTPLWIPQLIWASGLIMFTLTIYLIFTGTMILFFKKDTTAAQQLSGATTLEEEIEDGIVEAEAATQEIPGEMK